MKRIITVLLAFIMIFGVGAALCGCENNAKSDKLTVYTTIYPIYDFALKIGGEKANVRSIIPIGTEPHEWEPTGADVVNLSSADVLLYNGLGIESWIDDIKGNLKNTQIVCVSNGVSTLQNDNIADPHIWLDPSRAKTMLENIKNAFVSADNENAEYYNANFERFKAELENLDKDYADTLKNCSQKNIITVHRAFGYLCDRYSLTQITAEGAVSGSEPEAKVLLSIIEKAKSENIKTVFVAEEGASKVADTIAKEIGGEVKMLYNLENLTEEQTQNGDDYFSVMRTNLETLKEVLK